MDFEILTFGNGPPYIRAISQILVLELAANLCLSNWAGYHGVEMAWPLKIVLLTKSF